MGAKNISISDEAYTRLASMKMRLLLELREPIRRRLLLATSNTLLVLMGFL